MIEMFKNNIKGKTACVNIALALALVAAALAICIWRVFLLPQGELIAQLEDKCAIERDYVYKGAAFARKHPDAENYLKEMDEKLGLFENMLPSQIEISEFLRELERISKSAGVTIIDMQPLAEVKRDGYREFAWEMIIRGNFAQMLEFYKKIENSRRFISVTSSIISLSGIGQANQAVPELEGKIVLAVYSSVK